jgi:opacity protein-like surface antigen
MQLAGTCIAGLVLALMALPAAGQQGWYVKGGIGPAWTEELDVDEVVGPVSGVDAKFDVGIRFDIGGGYRFCEWFSAEVETGVIHNYIDEIGAADDLGDTSLANVPLLFNAVFELPTGTPFVPFAGVGAGVSFTVLTIDDVGGLDGDDSDAVFAYQGFAGVRYNISDQWSVNLTYKYFRTTDPSWEVRNASGDIEVEGARTHAVMAGFTFSF